MQISLNDHWTMIFKEKEYPCSVPCSLYDTLAGNGAIPDPYEGENEWISTPLSDEDVIFSRHIRIPETFSRSEKAFLRFSGIDTLADILWDGKQIGSADNMHRTWEFPLDAGSCTGEHLLQIRIHSPSRFVAEKQKERPLWGVESTMPGYPWLRKAHYMFGWDWGPVLPDMGIWRDVLLEGYADGRIRDVRYTQQHEQDAVVLRCSAVIDSWNPEVTAVWSVTDPDGKTVTAPLRDGCAEIRINHPRLWWVRGLGDQPLYLCRVTLYAGQKEADLKEHRIGLRTLTVSQEPDQWGKEFTFVNNGVKFFAMGANYIPEDQLLPRCTAERTVSTLRDCLSANYNFIRVWGGGYYPGEAFYDFCDENGIAVWQDFMFACSAYRLTPDFEQTVRAEIRDNVIRLRHHPSLALLCGNNEIESAWTDWGLPDDPESKADYLKLFEDLIPGILKETGSETFYWPSSPSSGGGFQNPSSPEAGDMHYWAVWHNFKPIEAFRQTHYRFCSEYGFESLPDLKTIRSFAGEDPLDLCSPVMEAHQKCVQGTEKLLYYLGQMVNYPYQFERLIYCTQLVQADCIRSNVEHMRRSRGRCMGSFYWQVNDSNPVISWSSIDSFGRWKGLHYAARRFYAPILLSCDDTDPLHPALYVSNDTRQNRHVLIVCRLRDRSGSILKTFTAEQESPALSSACSLVPDLTEDLDSREDRRTRYLEYSLIENGSILSTGTTLFVRPKTFQFLPAHIGMKVSETANHFEITLTADCFAKSVCLSLSKADCIFSDNWFDLHGNETVTISVEKSQTGLSLNEFKAQLTVTSYCSAEES